jgi:hypothetical protein
MVSTEGRDSKGAAPEQHLGEGEEIAGGGEKSRTAQGKGWRLTPLSRWLVVDFEGTGQVVGGVTGNQPS